MINSETLGASAFLKSFKILVATKSRLTNCFSSISLSHGHCHRKPPKDYFARVNLAVRVVNRQWPDRFKGSDNKRFVWKSLVYRGTRLTSPSVSEAILVRPRGPNWWRKNPCCSPTMFTATWQNSTRKRGDDERNVKRFGPWWHRSRTCCEQDVETATERDGSESRLAASSQSANRSREPATPIGSPGYISYILKLFNGRRRDISSENGGNEPARSSLYAAHSWPLLTSATFDSEPFLAPWPSARRRCLNSTRFTDTRARINAEGRKMT